MSYVATIKHESVVQIKLFVFIEININLIKNCRYPMCVNKIWGLALILKLYTNIYTIRQICGWNLLVLLIDLNHITNLNALHWNSIIASKYTFKFALIYGISLYIPRHSPGMLHRDAPRPYPSIGVFRGSSRGRNQGRSLCSRVPLEDVARAV